MAKEVTKDLPAAGIKVLPRTVPRHVNYKDSQDKKPIVLKASYKVQKLTFAKKYREPQDGYLKGIFAVKSKKDI